MKRVSLILFLFIVSTLSAQVEWVWQSPLPQGNHLNDVWVFDQQTVVGVGDQGTCLITSDEGRNWNIQSRLNDCPNDFSSVFFLDDSTGWIAGEIGALLKTVDQGANWVFQDMETSHDLNDIVFTDSDNGWIVGRWGKIFHSSDGGESWTEQNSQTYRNLRSVFFVDENTGWTVGHGGVILKTGDGGESWQEQESPTLSNLWSVFFVNQDTGWTAGEDGALLKTINGGLDWFSLDSGVDNDFSRVTFMNPDTGLVVGFDGNLDYFGILQKSDGVILKTTDGGQSWFEADSSSLPALNAVNFSLDGTGWAVGATGTILQSGDSGMTWERLSEGTSAQLTSVFFLDPDTGWTVGSGQILKTTDGGRSWVANPQPLPDEPNPQQYALRALQFLDPDTGYATASYYIETAQSLEMLGIILKTTDGGNTWEEIRRAEYEYHLDLQMLDADTGYVITGYVDFNAGVFKPQFKRTVNGGSQWNVTDGRLPNVIFYSLDFLDSRTGWLAGESGSIYKTTDGGQTWKGYKTGLNNVNFESVDFCDALHGWAAGSDGNIVCSDDGGLTWKRQEANTGEYLVALQTMNPWTAWVAGSGGIILNTLDGGQTWSRSETHTENVLYAIHFPTSSTGWVVGDNGNILKTTGGTTRVADPLGTARSLPAAYALQQNYPNPFNPETSIRFSIPRTDHVTLKVYDLLGRKVATLIDGLREAGNYQFRFRADNLPSGVYFYRLEAADFVQTRKLVIQK